MKMLFDGKYLRLQCLLIPITFLSVVPIGYHMISLNVPSKTVQNAILKEFHDRFKIALSPVNLDFIWSFIIACQSIGALLSFFLVSPLEQKFGTKRALLFINNIVLLIANSLFGLISPYTSTFFLLTLGRLLIGVYTGISCALVPIFIQELSPKHLKGALCCFVHISVCAGSAIGALLSLENILGGPSTWTILLSLPLFIAFAQLGLGYFLYEAPNFYIRQGNITAAVESIRFYYGVDSSTSDDTDTLISEYHSTVTDVPAQLSVKDAFSKPDIRKMLLLGSLISIVQVFSGSMAAVSYSTSMLESVSLTPWLTPLVPCIGSLLSIFLTLPAVRFVETCGRKQLIVNTLIVCAIANYLLVIFSLVSAIGPSVSSWASIAFVFSFFLYGIGYNIGVGPVAYFLPGELVPASSVSVAMGCSVALNWLSTMLTTLFFYPVQELIGGWTYLFFAIPTTAAALYFKRALPNGCNETVTSSLFSNASTMSAYHVPEERSNLQLNGSQQSLIAVSSTISSETFPLLGNRSPLDLPSSPLQTVSSNCFNSELNEYDNGETAQEGLYNSFSPVHRHPKI